MKIIHMSDIHLTQDSVTLDGLDTNARFAKAFLHAQSHHSDAARIVITGDLTHWADEEAYLHLRSLITKSPVPVRMLIGNHDAHEPFLKVFADHPRDANGFISFSEIVSGWHFLYLDSTEPKTHKGHICAERRAWLAAELERAGGQVLIFMHHNPLDLGMPASDILSLIPEHQAALRPILARHRDKIRYVFFGHVHAPLSGTLDGIPFSGVPSTGNLILPDFSPGDMLKSAHLEPSYRVVMFRDNDIIIHQIPFDWGGPISEHGTGWEDWAKPKA